MHWSSSVPHNFEPTPGRPYRKPSRISLPTREFCDTVTTCEGKGYYRVEVLYRQVAVAEYFVVKGFPKPSYWCVFTSESDFDGECHFKTLTAAKDFCVEHSI